jgi:hypothetical protein
MHATFAELVAEVRQRSPEEKGELLSILERELIEQRRIEIAENGASAEKESAEGNLRFSHSIDTLTREVA